MNISSKPLIYRQEGGEQQYVAHPHRMAASTESRMEEMRYSNTYADGLPIGNLQHH